LLGRTLAHPLLIAPMAYQRLAHPDGELAMALAAAAQHTGFILSTQASVYLEHVAAVVQQMRDEAASTTSMPSTHTPLWFQLYMQPRLDDTLALIDRAQAAGFEALVLTVDAPVQGVRDRERRAGFTLPPDVTAVNLPPSTSSSAPPNAWAGVLRHAPTWQDVANLLRQLEQPSAHRRLPVLLKGILHPDDARRARDVGAAGVIVSNHGGRTLDTALPTAWALPSIAQAVGADLAVLVDGGIRRGTDVFKALALGANAVLIGRPCLHGLAHAGAAGVAHVLRLLRDELDAAMALCGCATLADIHIDRIFEKQQ
jgi:4-hydroxymandelate oxidase